MKYIITITLTLISTAIFASGGSHGVIMKSHLAINALKISKSFKILGQNQIVVSSEKS